MSVFTSFPTQYRNGSLYHQSGAVLLVLMVVLVLSISSVLVSGIDQHSRTNSKHAQTTRVLAVAKKSLINYALVSENIPASLGMGFLPCPDIDGDGISDSPCGNLGESVEGWLPWQTLGGKPLKDGSGVCLRYAVSGNYKINPPIAPVLATTPGHFVIHNENNGVRVGNVVSEYALATIFAPSTPLAAQTRGLGGGIETVCGSSAIGAAKNQASNYLDQLSNVNNASGTFSGAGVPGSAALPTSTPSVFIQSDAEDTFNDRLIWITPSDFAKVFARLP